jgi:excinuclease ABC subunit A
LKPESLAVKFAGYDISQLSQMPLAEVSNVLQTALAELQSPPTGADKQNSESTKTSPNSGDTKEVAMTIATDLVDRIGLLTKLGLDYLAMDRATPTLSAGELQRLRLTTQLRSGLFGVVYVLDEPSAGLHPADADALFEMLMQLKEAGNSLFIVEHEMDIVRQADWIVDIGPEAGDGGGYLIYSGPVQGLAKVETSSTRKFLFHSREEVKHSPRSADNRLSLRGVNRHNLRNLDVEFPLGALTVVTGVSGSGKSTLVSQVLADVVSKGLGTKSMSDDSDDESDEDDADEDVEIIDTGKQVYTVEGLENIRRLVCVDQKPIGRTPRSNLATYTGLFDHIRKAFATTGDAKARKFNAGRFSFNVAGGRCTTCEGEGFVSVELLFLPSVYTPCSACGGTRYNQETLAIKYRGVNIAEVLDMTVDSASEFFTELPAVARALNTLRDVGLGYLHLGQPATELSGGEAQRIKLATELQRVQSGNTLYLLDEPTTGLHPADTQRLMKQLHALVDGGNTVIVVEHDMDVVGGADWIIDLGPGAGNEGGTVVAIGTPESVSNNPASRTAPYLKRRLEQ